MARKFSVCFVQYHEYVVEAEDEDEAIDVAHEEFLSDMYRPVAITHYDEVSVDDLGEADENKEGDKNA